MLKVFFKKKRNKQYSRLFLYQILMVVVAIIVTSTIIFMSFQQILMKKIYETQKDNLINASYSMDYTYELMKTLTLQLYFDRDISKLRNLETPEYNEINTATSRLSMYGAIMPYIQSIYIYSDISKTYYVTIPYGPSRTYEIGQFYDNDIKNIVDSAGQNSMLYPISRELPVVNGNNAMTGTKGFTFLYTEPPEGNNATEGAIVVNVSESWVRNMIGKYNSQAGNLTYVVDSKGRIVVNSSENGPRADISNEGYIRKILQSKNQYGYFNDTVNGTKSLLIYSVYKPFGWVFIRVIPFNNIMSEVNTMRNKTLLIGFIILLAGCIISVLISRKVYSPIDKMLSKLSVLEVERNNTLHARKKEYLKDIILGDNDKGADNPTFNIKILESNLDTNGKYVLLYLTIDHFNKFCLDYSIRDRNLLKFGIINITSELCSEYFLNEGVDLGDDHIAILLNIPEPLLETYSGILESLIKNIQSSTKSTVSVQVTVVVSPMGENLNSVHSLYDEARKLAFDRFFYGHECILFCDSIRKKEYSEYKYPKEKEKKLVDSLLGGNISNVKVFYNDIIEDSMKYPYYTMHLTLLRMVLAISSALNTIEENSGISFEFNFEYFVSELDRMESLEEVNQYFSQFFDSITEASDRKKNSKHPELLEHITNMIEKDFANNSLSLEALADQINMSPAYLGRLFNKLMSKSIVDYINEVRIKNAKEMLAGTDKSINDISSSAGFTNIQHFYRVFKRFSGVTPSEYRNSHGKMSI